MMSVLLALFLRFSLLLYFLKDNKSEIVSNKKRKNAHTHITRKQRHQMS